MDGKGKSHAILSDKMRHNHYDVKIFNLEKVDEESEIEFSSSDDDSLHGADIVKHYQSEKKKTVGGAD